MFKKLKNWLKNKKKGKVKNFYKARLHSMPPEFKPDIQQKGKSPYKEYYVQD